MQGSARKTGPWDAQEAEALTREVQRYMELKQGARAQRAAVAGQVIHTVPCARPDMFPCGAGHTTTPTSGIACCRTSRNEGCQAVHCSVHTEHVCDPRCAPTIQGAVLAHPAAEPLMMCQCTDVQKQGSESPHLDGRVSVTGARNSFDDTVMGAGGG